MWVPLGKWAYNVGIPAWHLLWAGIKQVSIVELLPFLLFYQQSLACFV